MKKLKVIDPSLLNAVNYRWYQRWWFIILVILTIPTNYGFSILLAGFLIFSRNNFRKNVAKSTNSK